MAALSEGEGDEKALRFYTACFDGNLDEVQRIVQGNPDLELNRVIHGGTAFTAAVQNSHVDVVRYLAGLGRAMETPIHDGAPPAGHGLHHAPAAAPLPPQAGAPGTTSPGLAAAG